MMTNAAEGLVTLVMVMMTHDNLRCGKNRDPNVNYFCANLITAHNKIKQTVSCFIRTLES